MHGAADTSMVRKEMNAADIASWDAKARVQFTYVSDGAVDTWRSWADKVLANEPWTGDCDDLAHTVLDLTIRAGASMGYCYRLFVMAEDGSGGHMVGAEQDDALAWWVVGDTYSNSPYPAAQMEHTPVDYNCLAEAGPATEPIWRKGVPWLSGQSLV